MIGVRVGQIISEVGAAGFFNAFFSTVQGLLEPEGAGTRFPTISNDFYAGCISAERVDAALAELRVIQKELAEFPPTAIIWDIEDRAQMPPWGAAISADITSMANYFVTSTGRDLLTTLFEMLEYAQEKNADVTIESV